MGADRRAHNSLADQKNANRIRSIFGQLEIEVIGSHAVGMTFHLEGEAGISQNDSRDLRQLFPRAGFERILSRIEKNIRHA